MFEFGNEEDATVTKERNSLFPPLPGEVPKCVWWAIGIGILVFLGILALMVLWVLWPAIEYGDYP